MNYPALKAALAGQTGTPEELAAWMAAPVSAPRGEIPRKEIKKVLIAKGKLGAVAESLTGKGFYADPDFANINLADPISIAIFVALVSASVLTSDDVAAINALGIVMVPRWQTLGIESVPHTGDIEHALSLS